MTEWGRPGGEPSQRGEPVDPNAPQNYGQAQPYGGYPQQPTYPQQAYPQPAYAQPAYPGYPPQQAANPWGYPQPYAQPYGQGYPQADRRPGTAIASAVLGYVNAGILILAGALLLFGASIVSDFENSFDTSTDYGTEIAVDGFVNLIAAGLLIAGAIMLTGRNPVGRILYTVGSVVVLGEAVYWLVRFDNLNAGSVVVWSVLFIALSVVGLALVWTPDVNRWMTNRGQPG